MFDIDRVMQVMSEILSDMYDCKVTLTAIPKDQAGREGDCRGFVAAAKK